MMNAPARIRLVGPFTVIAATPEAGVVRYITHLPMGTDIFHIIDLLEFDHPGLPFLVYRPGETHPAGRRLNAGIMDGRNPPVIPNYALTRRADGELLLVLSRDDAWVTSPHDPPISARPGHIRIHRWDGHAYVQIRERINP